MSTYLDLFRYRELFGSLFRRDLRAKYKGSVLGLAWSLAHPVVLMLVYLLVFSVMLKIQTADYDHYWLFLLGGLPAWVFFATSLQSASRSLLENANLIRKVRFPRQLTRAPWRSSPARPACAAPARSGNRSARSSPRRARSG